MLRYALTSHVIHCEVVPTSDDTLIVYYCQIHVHNTFKLCYRDRHREYLTHTSIITRHGLMLIGWPHVIDSYSCCKKVTEFAEVVHVLPNAETHGVISLQFPAMNGSIIPNEVHFLFDEC